VGSYSAEALARAGVGSLTLVDYDVVSISNLNRQLIALYSTMGMLKVEVMRARILDINPEAAVCALPLFYPPDDVETIDLASFDYILDAIDTVSSKADLIVAARDAGTPIVSCMGAGNRLDPTRFVVTDLWDAHGCPLARLLRRELRARGVEKLTVVHSTELPRKPEVVTAETSVRRGLPGSVSFVPPVAGMVAAGVVVTGLLELRTH